MISNFFPPHIVGGAEIVAYRQALRLVAEGWKVVVFAGRVADGAARRGSVEVDEFGGLPVYRINYFTLDVYSNFLWDLADRSLKSLITTYNPSWVHFHNPIGLGANMLRVAKRMGVKVAVTLHDHWGFCFKNTLLRNDNSVCLDFENCHACKLSITVQEGTSLPIRVRRDYVAWCLDHADHLVSPSRSLARNYEKFGVPKDRIEIISNGIDVENIPAVARRPQNVVHFLSASYLGEHKGIPVLLAAIRLLLDNPELAGRWDIKIAGHGHLENAVTALVAEVGELGCVSYVGRLPRPELLTTLGEAHVVVLPSIWPENEPVILLEAIASGAAIIATDIGGNGDIFEGVAPGLLCKAGEAADLAQAMASFIINPDVVAAYSDQNLTRIRRGEEATIARLLEIYSAAPNSVSQLSTVVICGGGQPDEHTFRVIEQLSRYSGTRNLRLLWQGWCDADVWSEAAGFWWWSTTGGLQELSGPARRGVAICVREGVETSNISKLLPVTVYKDVFDLFKWLASLTPPLSGQSKMVEPPIMRHFNQLRNREAFNLAIKS